VTPLVELTAWSVVSYDIGLQTWQWLVVHTSAPASACPPEVMAYERAATAWARNASGGQFGGISFGTTPLRYSSSGMVTTRLSGSSTRIVEGTLVTTVAA